MQTKRCTKCGVVKDASKFHRRKASSDGLAPRCKICNSAHNAEMNYSRSKLPKKCTKCGIVRAASEFYAARAILSGLTSTCKKCRVGNYPRSKSPKKCTKCEAVKSATEFYTRKASLDGLLSWCKICDAAKRKLRAYGVAPETHLLMLESQNYACICGKPVTMSDPIDHCHETGRVRNILCANCNCTLGYTDDNPSTLRKLADNLERHQQLEARGVSQWGYVPTTGAEK